MEVKKIATKAGELMAIAAVLGFIGSLWIDREVERRMNELAIDPSAAPTVVALKTDMQNVKESQVRIENKVDTFSASFMAYLEREAGR